MEFKHWLVVFLCFVGPFGWYYLYWLPRQREQIDQRKSTLSMLRERMIPALVKIDAQTPLKCFNTLKIWVDEFHFTEGELGYSINDLARFTQLCVEKQLAKVKGERDLVHQQLVEAKTNADRFLSLYQWAVHVEATHHRFKDLCRRYDALWSDRGNIHTQIDSVKAQDADRNSLLFLTGESSPRKA